MSSAQLASVSQAQGEGGGDLLRDEDFGSVATATVNSSMAIACD
jgi:hypothetical protein